MVTDIRRSTIGPATQAILQPESSHWPTRISLIVIAAFMALSAIAGAIFVVPTLPRSMLGKGWINPFADFTIPALALGILCGGAALIALVAVIRSPGLGALASFVTGVFMIGFELVEIAAVGFTAAMEPTEPAAWLQVVYLAVGAALAIVGLRLWKAVTGSYRLR